MRFSVVRIALAIVASAAISSCSENPISTVKPIEAPTPQTIISAERPILVISQIYGGGGNSGAPLKNDYIEIFNPGTSPVSLAGWSVQYASATGSSWQVTALNGTIQPGQYYLVQEAAGTNTSATPLPTPDATGTIPMSGTAGKVALVQATSALSGTCPTASPVVDLVSFGTTANCGPTTPTLSNTTAALRLEGGCKWTDDPSADFATAAPAPRNTSSALNPCGGDDEEPAVVDSVSVTPATATVYVNGTVQFTAKAFDANDNEIANVVFDWQATNANATVNASGVATGVTAGVVSIIATSPNGKVATAELTVEEAPVIVNGPERMVEIHYDNASTDVGEAIEVEGPADMNLDGWKIEVYNLTDGRTYATFSLSSASITVCGTRAVASIATPAIQNGPSDGFALVSPTNQVVEFLSYEGTLTATNGAAAGMTSTDIGVNEPDTSPVGFSLQRDAAGWYGPEVASFGACNTRPVLSTATVVINEIMENPLRATGGASWGEWFEVHNYGTTAVDLQGWTIASQGTGQVDHVIATSVVVAPGGYAVLGRGSDLALNGGVTLDYNYFTGSSSTHFMDSADRLELRDGAGARVDIVSWTAGGFSRGVSRGVRNPLADNSSATNANWGHSTTQYGDGDFGTPGAANGTLSNTPPAVPNFITFSGRTSGDAPLPVGFEAQVFATLNTSAGATVPTTFTWTALTPEIASIDADGVIHAHAAGTAMFRAQAAADGTTGTHTLPMIVATASTTAQYANNAEFGEPTDADASDDFIVRRAQFTSSYNAVKNIPNWVAYNLDATHIASGQDRCNCFTFDPELPSSFFRYTTADYTGAGAVAGFGIDRGHLARSFDRTTGTLDNATTYYFTNIIPQFADNNQGPWAAFENYLGSLAQSGTKEVHIIAGASGAQGTVKNEGNIVIPMHTWKVAVIMDRDEGLANVQSPSDIQVIAVVMPNAPGIRNVAWETYKVTVDSVEALSGYDVLTLLSDNIETAVESNTSIPVAATDGPYTSAEGSSVALSGAASSDADGHALTYSWSFGDGATATGSTTSHTYAQDGTYTVQLVVTDILGIADTTSTTATVANVAPSVTIANGASLLPGETYGSAGSFSDPGADTWSATVDYGDGSGAGALALSGNTFALSHQYNTAGTFTVTVAVSDDDATSSAVQTVVVISALDAISNLSAQCTTTSLKSKLAAAKTRLQNGNVTAAVNILNAFINEVRDMISTGALTEAQGEALIVEARRIIASISR